MVSPLLGWTLLPWLPLLSHGRQMEGWMLAAASLWQCKGHKVTRDVLAVLVHAVVV